MPLKLNTGHNSINRSNTRYDYHNADRLADKKEPKRRYNVLAELDSARLDGAYAGNRLKKYWQRPIKEEEINKKGNENGRNATQIDS